MRKIVKMGTIGAAIIIVLAGISTYVDAQTIITSKDFNSLVSKLKATKTNNERFDIVQQIKNKIKESGWYPGMWIIEFFDLIFTILFFFFFPTPPPP